VFEALLAEYSEIVNGEFRKLLEKDVGTIGAAFQHLVLMAELRTEIKRLSTGTLDGEVIGEWLEILNDGSAGRWGKVDAAIGIKKFKEYLCAKCDCLQDLSVIEQWIKGLKSNIAKDAIEKLQRVEIAKLLNDVQIRLDGERVCRKILGSPVLELLAEQERIYDEERVRIPSVFFVEKPEVILRAKTQSEAFGKRVSLRGAESVVIRFVSIDALVLPEKALSAQSQSVDDSRRQLSAMLPIVLLVNRDGMVSRIVDGRNASRLREIQGDVVVMSHENDE
jgi:hypothetical protein